MLFNFCQTFIEVRFEDDAEGCIMEEQKSDVGVQASFEDEKSDIGIQTVEDEEHIMQVEITAVAVD